MALVPFAQYTSPLSWMQEGEIVAVSGLAARFAKYESMLWIIEENPDQESKVLLNAVVQRYLFIRVRASKISPASLTIAVEAQAHLSQTLNFQFDLPFHWKMESWIVSQLAIRHNDRAESEPEPYIEPYLNQWIPLPDDQNGGNKIMLRRCTRERERPLLMYPRLEALGLELVFFSRWYGGQTEIIEIDILKPCPARHIWVFCAWCGKFHLPFDGFNSHRCSRKHQNARWYMDNRSKHWLRERCGFMHIDGRWL